MISAVIFDFGFTLFYFRDASVKKYFECFKEGLSKSADYLEKKIPYEKEFNKKHFIETFNKWRLDSYKSEDKSFQEINTPTLFKKLLKEIDFPILSDNIYHKLAKIYHSCEESEWTPFDETEKTLKTLKDMDIKIGLISNHPYHKSILKMLENYDLRKYFDTIMTSGKFGKRKPHKKIFLETMKRMELEEKDLSKIIVCGDEYADVVGADRVGLIPVLYLRKVEFPYEKEINIPNMITIKKINEIIDIIKDYNN